MIFNYGLFYEIIRLMLKQNVSLKPYNTFAIDAKAQLFAEVATAEALQELLAIPELLSLPKIVLGGGSNILFTQDFPGLVIKISIQGIHKVAEDENHVWLRVGAGENWHQLVLHCLENNYAGIENLSLIPGTVGAAPLQNIGAYGVELRDVFDQLTAIRISDQESQIFNHQQCHFGYRDSVFKTQLKNQYIITTVSLRLNKKPSLHTDYGGLKQTLQNMQVKQLTIKTVSDAVIKIRTEKLPDPAKIGNAGSFFKNPVIDEKHAAALLQKYPHMPHFAAGPGYCKIPAAWLIEQCGWKGHRIGNAGVHEHHALVLVNYGNEVGSVIKKLAEDIQQSVKEKFAIVLTPEVNMY